MPSLIPSLNSQLRLHPFFLSVLLLSLLPALTMAQKTAARPDRGMNPGGAYSVSDIENVNLQNGNVNLAIPLASLPPIAGGKLSLTVSATYNSKLWNMTRTEAATSGTPYRTYVVDTPAISDAGGWKIGGAYELVVREASEDFAYEIPPAPPSNDAEALAEYQRLTQHNWYKVILRTPDGAEHELRPSSSAYHMYAGANHPRSYLWGYFYETPDNTGTSIRYNSTDGTYLSAIVNPANHASNIKWTIFLPDGTQVIKYADDVERIRDNNGNAIKIYSDSNGTHYQDEQTGREIRVGFDPNAGSGYGQSQVWYQAVGGVWQHVDINFGQTVVKGKVYKVHDWNPNIVTETGLEGAECTRQQQLSNTSLSVVREIVFPATEPAQPAPRFSFAYNSDNTENVTTQTNFTCGGSTQTYTRDASRGMGALSRIVMPSDAVVDYNYSLAATHDFFDIEGADKMVKEALGSKVLTHDGTSETWTYNIPNTSNATNSSVSGPDGSVNSQNFYAMNPGFALSFGTDDPRSGLVYHTSNGLTETYRHWNMQGTQIASGADHSSAVNTFVDVEYTSLVGTSLMKATAYQHDANGNVTQTKEYDWFDSSAVARDAEGVPTAVPGAATVLRVTNTSYYNAADVLSSANYYGLRSVTGGVPSILNAVKETTVGPSITRFSYDGQAYGNAPTVGNLTAQSSWDDVDNKWITTSQTYGAYGNLVTKTDARGKSTQFYYDDASHAAPNRVVVDPENGTGTQTSTTSFDYSTGLVTSSTDANGNTSTIDYTNQLLGTVDPFGRPGTVIGPLVNAGGSNQRRRVNTTYIDHLRQVVAASDLYSENDKLLKSRTTNDMLGRVILTEQTEDGTNYTISASKVYEQSGRITYSSNPARSAASTTDGWTRITNDVFGRTIEVATFGGAAKPAATGYLNGTGAVTTSYAADFTTVTDQSGKVRRSKVDGLGRLVRVDEPGANNDLGSTANPVQTTNYTYDAAGNLLTVVQGGQTRTFTYDSLARLRSAINPENGSVTYQYDDNNNLVVKTDARNVSVHYSYDALNRPLRRWYNSSSATSASVNNSPALATSIGATPEVTYSYDSSSITNGKGRLASVSSTVSTLAYLGYNSGGQPDSISQTIGSQSYLSSYVYGLAGHVEKITYPSGHVVNYNHDRAGRLGDKDSQNLAFAGNLGGVTRTYSRNISYTAAGALSQEQFGTDAAIYNKLAYNSRGQLAETRVSTAGNDDSWNRGKILNQYSLQCSGAGCNASDNNGNLRKQEIFIPNNEQNTSSTSWDQQYEYDTLNRLTEVHEHASNNSLVWHQSYSYDRFGNRSINAAGTTQGVGINSTQATVVPNTTTNRLYGPNETEASHPLMAYDDAGNQTKDLVSPNGGTREYDAENRLTLARDANGNQVAAYFYDGDGRRVRRSVTGETEVWQAYGADGSMLAEYAANTAWSLPRKEYGYRNGQLLITAEGMASLTVSATASQTYAGFSASRVTDGNPDTSWIADGYSPQWVLLDLAAAKDLTKVRLLVEQNPAGQTTHQIYGGATADNLSLLGTLSGVTQAGQWLELDSTATSVRYVKVVTSQSPSWVGWKEIEVYGTQAAAKLSPVSLTASGSYGSYSTDKAADNNTGTWWTAGGFASQWIQLDLGQAANLSKVRLLVAQDPSGATTHEIYGGATSGNLSLLGTLTGTTQDTQWLELTSAATNVRYVKIVTTSSPSWVAWREIEVYGTPPGANVTSTINWLVADQLGTPRMVLDQTGSLAATKRHDYLPFGEEVFNGGRSTALGYGVADGVRQKFTSKERDAETGLDYFGARYYADIQGRFTGADAFPVTKESFLNPQRWNLYVYVNNNPLVAVDPTGRDGEGKGADKVISVFLDVALKDLGNRVTRDSSSGAVTKSVPNTTDWQGTIAGAPSGYRVDVYGNNDVTGNRGFPKLVNQATFENALQNSAVVLYVGHGRGDVGTVPFEQRGIVVGSEYYTPDGSGPASGVAIQGEEQGFRITGPRPETTASVVGNFSCNASRNGGSYFSFVGKNQVMISVDSQWDGVTTADALDKAANAFVKTYMATNGNVEKAVAAANAVLAKSVAESEKGEMNRGDNARPEKMN